MAQTEAQLKALAITPKITASLSIISSIIIILEVIHEHRHGRGRANLRALFGMCFIDLWASTGWFLSTWPAPAGSNAVYNVGNTAFCTFQGFLLQVAIGAPLYNATMALYYLLTINYGWREEDLRRIEPFLHGFILVFSFGTALLMVPLGTYNHIGAVCWTIGLPQGCENSNYHPSDVPCERGNYAWIYGLVLFYIPLWIVLIFSTIAMFLIWHKFRRTERRNLRYAGSQTGLSFVQTQRIATQAILYQTAFFITWFPSTIWSLTQWTDKARFWLDMAAAICEPSQGSLNLLVFLRPRPETRERIKHHICCCLKGKPCFLKGKPESLPRTEMKDSTCSLGERSSNQNTAKNIESDGPMSQGPRVVHGVDENRVSIAKVDNHVTVVVDEPVIDGDCHSTDGKREMVSIGELPENEVVDND